MDYQDFLSSKLAKVTPSGFDIPESDLPDNLFDYQRFVVRLALNKGKFALFASTGRGKSLMQLVWAMEVARYTNRPVLILAPLAVAKQTAGDECTKWGIHAQYCESQDDVIRGINVTNYEKLSKFDPKTFSGVVLDESSILKSFSGAMRTQIIEAFSDTPYKLACSATPSPNDYMELGNHAEFLGIMSRTEMLAQYFIHDSSDTSKWRLKGHADNPFWKFLSEWAIMFQSPSDLGFDGSKHILPPLNENFLKVETGIKRDGELFALTAQGLLEQRQVKKLTIDARCQAVADLVNNSTDQWLVWCETNDESALLKSLIPDSVEVKGADKDSHKENSAMGFSHGKIRVLVSKPSIFGFGMNWQNCNNIVFSSLSNSFEMTYQAVRRCYRFGQEKPVNVYYVMTDSCGSIKANIERKTEQFNEMFSQLVKHMGTQTMTVTQAVKNDYDVKVAKGQNYTLTLGDCIEGVAKLEDNSIDFSIFSPPFSSLYTYSNSERDMGNCKDDSEFFEHFDYLIQNLYRVIKPGRLVSFHCMDMPSMKFKDGFIGIRDFRGDLIRAFQKHGFILHSQVTIRKDPVLQMQRTKSIGLLHKQVKKDSAMSRMALPDYLITMRKPGDNLEPIAGRFEDYYGTDTFTAPTAENFSIECWQRYAEPVWWDIDASDVLNYRDARDSDDERHIAPLQLTVIRRALQLWSNKGDVVLSPFAGIGSEGYVSLDMDRRFIGFELKQSYWEIAKKNLEHIENKPKQVSLFDVA